MSDEYEYDCDEDSLSKVCRGQGLMPEQETDDLTRLERIVTAHIEDYENHVKEYSLALTEMKERHKRQDDLHEKALNLMTENSKQIKELTEATRGIVDAWGTVHNIQRFLKWFTPFTLVLGALLAWAVSSVEIVSKVSGD